MILPQIKAKLEERLGQQICSPSDCHALSIDIEKRTGQHLGVNTIKRMLGILGDEVEPRTSTLNLIAQYLGYANWNVLKLIADGEGNSDFDSIPQIITCELKVGQHVILTYEPKRKVTLKYIGDGTFCVTESLLSKMQTGDIVRTQQFILGQPLYCIVQRDGVMLGNLTAGKIGGLTSLKCK